MPYAVALQVSQVCDVRCSNAVSSLTGHQLEKQTSRGIGLRFFRGFQPANVKDTTDPAMWLAITKLGTSEIMREVDNIAMVATYICIVGNSQLAATFLHLRTAEEYLLCSLAPLSEQTSNYRIIRNH